MSDEEVEASIRFALGASAAAGHEVSGQVLDDARQALRGEITFDEAIARAAERAMR